MKSTILLPILLCGGMALILYGERVPGWDGLLASCLGFLMLGAFCIEVRP